MLGNLTTLISKIEPAVASIKEPVEEKDRTSANGIFVNQVAKKNVEMTIEAIRERSEVLSEMEKKGEIKIMGAMYDISTGAVTFYE